MGQREKIREKKGKKREEEGERESVKGDKLIDVLSQTPQQRLALINSVIEWHKISVIVHFF